MKLDETGNFKCKKVDQGKLGEWNQYLLNSQ